MYEPPINIFTTQSEMIQKINERTDELVIEAVHKVGVDVDKDELIKAITYDRNQYEKGFKNGYSKAENDYFKQTEKDRQSSYDCGYQNGRADAIEDYTEWLRKAHANFDEDYAEDIKSDYLEQLKDSK